MHRSPAEPNPADDRGVGGQVEVGVGQHEHVVLRPAERLHPLAVRGAGRVDVPGDRGGADERHRPHVRVRRAAASTASLSPCTTPNTPSGSPASRHSSARQQRRRRVLLRRLEHERVAAGDRDREHPQRHHRREVERRDPGDHAERLADRVGVDAGGDVLGVAALEQVRDAAGELDHLDAAGDLAERVGVDLAVLGGDQRGRARRGAGRAARGTGTAPGYGGRARCPARRGTRRPRRRPPRPPRRRWRGRRARSPRRSPGRTAPRYGRRPARPPRRSSA